MTIKAHRLLAHEKQRYWVEEFCRVIQEGKTPDSEILKELGSALSQALFEINEIPDGEKRRSEKVGRALAKNLGLLNQRKRPRSYEDWEREVNIAIFFDDLTEKIGRNNALAETAINYGKDDRTIERYLAAHRKTVDFVKNMRRKALAWEESAVKKLLDITKAAVEGRLSPQHDSLTLSLCDVDLIVKPLKKNMLEELATLEWAVNGFDEIKAIDWWFSNSIYETKDSFSPVGQELKISEMVVGYSLRFINSLSDLYGDK